MPRASAAALEGSGFDPASGGQMTAATPSPASSRRLSTCSANAACPTRRTRIPGSALEVRCEEALQALPRVARRLGLVGSALVAEEAMVRTRINDHLGLLAGAGELGLQLLDGVEWDEGVLLAEEGEDRSAELWRLVDRDAASVEGSRRLDLLRELAGGEVAHAATHAEPGDADPVGSDEGLPLEVADGAAHVRDDVLVAHALHERDRLPDLIVADRASLAGPPVEVGREGDVALGGDPPRHVLDVPVQPERLLDDEDPRRACRSRRAGDKARHPARRGDLDHLRLHIHQGAAPFRGVRRAPR